MFLVVNKEYLNASVTRLTIEAPLIAAKARAGQFVIIRVNETGERIPLTINDHDTAGGTVTVVAQQVGKTTMLLSELDAGDELFDIVGPLGRPSELDGISSALIIGGGVGCAISYPQAKALHASGADVDIIAGFRSKDLLILEPEMAAASDNLYIVTDDGSYKEKGFVTSVLKRLITEKKYDTVIAVGPIPMMKAVCDITREHRIKTIISMNSIMIDGTGMCGCCRVSVGGETKFACVDGPDFDGHLVDFDLAMKRSALYRDEESEAVHRHKCRLTGEDRVGKFE